jgi:hypothetical protein
MSHGSMLLHDAEGFFKLSPILTARYRRRSARRETLAQSVCSFGTLMIIMEPGVDARPLLFLPLFTQVLRVLAGLTISFSARQHATYREFLARGS